jgi:hypothetical protein
MTAQTDLKLFVVGQRGPNPDDWDDDVEWCLVIAASPEEAKALVGDDLLYDTVHELVPSGSARIIFTNLPLIR